MSNQEICIDIIRNLDEYQAADAANILRSFVDAIERAKLKAGMETPLSECVEDDNAW